MGGGARGVAAGGRPVERETFYDAQRRHRRSSCRFTVLSAVAVVILGLPLSVLVSPVASGLAIMATDALDPLISTPDLVAEIEDVVDRWSEARDADDRGEPASYPVAQAALIAGLLLVPGIVAMLGAWLLVRRVFMRAAAGAVVLASGARPPDPTDVGERRLTNLVAEMALAAGVPPPRVMVVDANVLNAAVVGRSVEDVTIIVPRRLLDSLGRDPTSAVIADLLATVVNGDLRAALVIGSVFQTFDLVGAMVAAPLSRRTRRMLWRLVRMAVGRRPRGSSVAGPVPGPEGPMPDHGLAEYELARELADLAVLGGLDDEPGSERSGCLTFPFLAASVAYSMTMLFVGSVLVVPMMAALWRRRRLLADATAVELTRNPDALVEAFEGLEAGAAGVPPGPWAHLFLVGPEVRAGLAKRRFDQQMAALRADEQRPGESAWAVTRRRMRESGQPTASTRLRSTRRPATVRAGRSSASSASSRRWTAASPASKPWAAASPPSRTPPSPGPAAPARRPSAGGSCGCSRGRSAAPSSSCSPPCCWRAPWGCSCCSGC
jgi:Zn-dependent protease with chaperone function